MKETCRVYLGIGSNIGDRLTNIKVAIEHLEGLEDIQIKRVSCLYESEPVGGPPQGEFLNGVIEVETSLSPRELLARLKDIELKLGRKRIVPDGPRTIDLDILLYRDLTVNDEDLKIPHPRMSQRRFVLEPLTEIAPDLIHPISKKKVSQLFREVQVGVESSGLPTCKRGIRGKRIFPISAKVASGGRREDIRREP